VVLTAKNRGEYLDRRGKELQGDRENYIMRNFIIYTPFSKYYCGEHIKENDAVGTYSKHEKDTKCTKKLWQPAKNRFHL
jgi:hypothetical protein